ncbi:MAG: hypothetical protein ACXACI_13025 [Candidatus Hodarchaeales archaeon]|jgi:hypothetical protein
MRSPITDHDHILEVIERIALAMGYKIEEKTPGSRGGLDLLIYNPVNNRRANVEVEVGSEVNTQAMIKKLRQRKDRLDRGEFNAVIIVFAALSRMQRIAQDALLEPGQYYVLSPLLVNSVAPALLGKILS